MIKTILIQWQGYPFKDFVYEKVNNDKWGEKNRKYKTENMSKFLERLFFVVY